MVGLMMTYTAKGLPEHYTVIAPAPCKSKFHQFKLDDDDYELGGEATVTHTDLTLTSSRCLNFRGPIESEPEQNAQTAKRKQV
ncbi:hypothetical protein LNQ03_33005 [Klebsiella pneumoniae subsp. pneumoniae]|nr:hypothetical protein [Klebsiella pneumoniae subsp. pneumoniae]